MGSETPLVHVFLVSFPGQGHVNPLLRLGKRLAAKGLLVTFATTENFGSAIKKASDVVTDQLTPVGDGFIRFEFIDDELEVGDPCRNDLDQYLVQLDQVGRRRLPQMLSRLAAEGRPVSCLINNPFIPWVCDVAEELGLPSAMLWVQSAACFLSYYYYYHGLVPFPTETEPYIDVQIPTLPLLKWDEIPSFLHPTTPYPFLRRAIMGQYKNLSKPFCVLMDTYQELEHEIIEYTSNLCPIKPVGPLFKNPKAQDSTVRGDQLKADGNCITWLDTQPAGSVVYISFGTVVYLKQAQIDEIAHGILAAGVSFLWVMKPPGISNADATPHTLPEGFLEKIGNKGKIVHYSPQEQVLAHPAVACFVTHCGWNSMMESLTSGMPVVAFPQWGDQVTDAKFLVDVFGTGVRMCRGEHEDRIVPRDEVESCLREATTGPKAEERKKNALKWKKAAEDAVADGGSSDRNIQAFVEEAQRRSLEITAAAAGNKKSGENATMVANSIVVN
ncbi:hypothetical protein Droror1_Dr00007457 [Drosera rotundifolia]